jgi:uncharacterized protein HemX
MNERREPTISGMRVDPEERARARAQQGAATNPRAQARPVSSRPVVVKSRMAPFAFLVALIACGAAGYLYWQFMESQKVIAKAEQRIANLEESLKLTDSESTQTVASIQDSLKTHFSEIDKLWGNYRKHRNSIAKHEKDIAAIKKDGVSKVDALAADLGLTNELIEKQRSTMQRIENDSASLSAQSRKLNEKMAKLERTFNELNSRLADTEKDIEAINGFRRTVNQQLLELRSAQTPTP